MPAKDIAQLCKRCNALEAAVNIRNEPLCQGCFSYRIQTKVVKRMETFRTKNVIAGQTRTLLLPMSFGVSSVSLLHFLQQHLNSQMQHTGRMGFSLHILHITSPDSIDKAEKRLGALESAYPHHKYSTAALEDLFAEKEGLHTLLQQSPSASAIADILSLLQTRLAVHFAKTHNCEAILWSCSTTTLAEKVLASTAKGRGFSLPWQICDGPTPYGCPFYYPLREVLRKELIAHAQMTDPPLARLVDPQAFESTQAPPSARNTTIDVLMKQYFEDVEESYPNIVSNVVRTTAKLRAPTIMDASPRCRLCDLPVEEAKMGIKGWGGYQDADEESGRGNGLCYGCSRSVAPDLVHLLPTTV